MPLDPQYLDAIKGFEGFTPQASWDYKQYSNGYGTKALYPGEVIDRDMADQRFNDKINEAYAHVESIAPNAPPGVKAALTSLTYNAGPGWSQSGLGDLVRAGDWQGAAERFQQYNKAGGQVNQGLVNRRGKEAAWFSAQDGAPQMPQLSPPVTVKDAPVGILGNQMPPLAPPVEVKDMPVGNVAPIYARAQQRSGPPLQTAPQSPNLPAFGFSPQQQAYQPDFETPLQFQTPQINYAQRRPPNLTALQMALMTRLRPGFLMRG